ncbi:MAG: inositol monophosphatase family protein [Gemmatimonadales bacterium]|nr:inositol monophosphatase family protein [Gemmatimonadales bacterium]
MTTAEGLARLAERAAARAAAYLLDASPPAPADWDAKGHHDFVTEMDRESERRITETLLRAEPSSRILGEELSPDDAGLDGLVWVVDPIDGTANFLHRHPAWAVSIGAAIDGELIAGTIFHVPAGRRYTAWRGGGAWSGSERLRVSPVSNPAQALIGTGFPFKNPELLPTYLPMLAQVLPQCSGVRRGGSAALDLVDVASGRFAGFWEMMLAPWDMAAGIVLVREAGGVVTDFSGRNMGVEHSPVIAGNEAMAEWLGGVVGRSGER